MKTAQRRIIKTATWSPPKKKNMHKRPSNILLVINVLLNSLIFSFFLLRLLPYLSAGGLWQRQPTRRCHLVGWLKCSLTPIRARWWKLLVAPYWGRQAEEPCSGGRLSRHLAPAAMEPQAVFHLLDVTTTHVVPRQLTPIQPVKVKKKIKRASCHNYSPLPAGWLTVCFFAGGLLRRN